jgi:hypothetical protein
MRNGSIERLALPNRTIAVRSAIFIDFLDCWSIRKPMLEVVAFVDDLPFTLTAS